MGSAEVRSETAIDTPKARTADMKLEVIVIPVSDVDRAKRVSSVFNSFRPTTNAPERVSSLSVRQFWMA